VLLGMQGAQRLGRRVGAAGVPFKWTEPPAHPARPPTVSCSWAAGRGVRVGSPKWDAH
jgi:hypothetical protein